MDASKINPSHYKVGSIDAIDYYRAILTSEEFKGYLKGNMLKYMLRAGRKEGEPAEDDHGKAAWFRERFNFYFGQDS